MLWLKRFLFRCRNWSNARAGFPPSETIGSVSFYWHRLSQGEKVIVMLLKDVLAKVNAETQVVTSAVVLLDGLKAKLDAAIANNSLEDVQAISDAIDSQRDALGAAVARNTLAESPVNTNPGTPAPAEEPAAPGGAPAGDPAPVDPPATPDPATQPA